MNTANRRLMTGAAVYMLGNAVSKVLQLLLLPVITGVLLTSEFGYYDLIISTVSLVLPVITLQSGEAVFKFLFTAKGLEKRRIISTVTIFLMGGNLLTAVLLFVFNVFSPVIKFPMLIVFYFTTFSIFTLYQKIARSSQKNIHFAISGMVQTIVLIAVELLLLFVFKMRIDGLLIANVVANLTGIIYLEVVVRLTWMISWRDVKLSVLRSILSFSVPLVPNSISWWFVSACNTYFITIFLGMGSNGIYSVMNKFPQLLIFITAIFQMAWQESAILESGTKTRNGFYSEVFNVYVKILFTAMLVVLPLIKLLMPYLINKTYLAGVISIPILLAGVIFSSLSQFYGVGYLAFNKTKDALATTIISAIINCSLCVALISSLGLLAPALSTMSAYMVQWIYRIWQMHQYFRLQIKWKQIVFYFLLVIGYTAFFYTVGSICIQSVLFVVACGFFLFVNWKLLVVMYKSLVKGGNAVLLRKQYTKDESE